MSDTEEVKKYEFDLDFQTKIAACIVRDPEFNLRTEGLINPFYFENAGIAYIAELGLSYFRDYRKVATPVVFSNLIKDAVKSGKIRSDYVSDVRDAFMSSFKDDISDAPYVADCVAEFARHRAFESAILKSVSLIEKRDFSAIEKVVNDAMNVGVHDDIEEYEYFDAIEHRTNKREDRLSGKKEEFDSISSGVPDLDKHLYWEGWGRKELTVFMGAPKMGKSQALAFFARNAALLGYSVLFVSLEVSKDIISDRIDASVSEVPMKDLVNRLGVVSKKVEDVAKTAGKLYVAEFPTGTLTCSALRRLINRHKSKGRKFDMVVVDYADIMAAEHRSRDPREDSKSIYVGLRAIAQMENVVMMTATQTNREGAKADVSRMEHVAEDFNKVRIADLVISINKTEEERMRDQARLYFAASRNQAGDFSLVINQDVACMQFITDVIGKS